MRPPGMAGGSFFFGVSATIASVVIIRPAIDAAFLQRDTHDLGRVDEVGVRLERLPGGACTHWKAPPWHGARK